MTTLTFGPPQVLDGPLPEPPPGRLLSVPGVLQDPGNDRWMNGVALWGYPDGTPLDWDPCATGTFRPKSDESNIPTPIFAAFTGYLPLTCSAFSIASAPEAFSEKSEIAMDAKISFGVERMLSQGGDGPDISTNPFLADANVTVLASGNAVSPTAGFAYLEEAIGGTAIGGMIHATPGAASAYFGPWRDYRLTVEGVPFAAVTPLGTPIAIGGGYIGATPHGHAAAGEGESWIFATGPVWAFVDAETKLDLKQVLDRTDNVVTFRAERQALALWDTALQVAVLVNWGDVA